MMCPCWFAKHIPVVFRAFGLKSEGGGGDFFGRRYFFLHCKLKHRVINDDMRCLTLAYI